MIHPTSLINPGAKLGLRVEIGPYTIVHGNVIIGSNTKIGAYCELGLPTHLGDGTALEIANDSLIRSHSVFYESSSFGFGLTTGHGVTVRENTIAGNGFQIGTLSELQGDCQVGDYVRFQSNVFVGKETVIGNFVWALPYSIMANDPTPPSNDLIGCTIEDYAVISASAIILRGITIGKNSLVAAHACATKDVPPHMIVAGVPARIIGEAKAIIRRDDSGKPAYPWTAHFHRGYPDEIVEMWEATADTLENSQ